MTELKHEFTWTLPATPARVFAALTNADELTQWFAEHAEVEPKLGGAYRFWGKHTYGAPKAPDSDQRITAFAPNQTLAFTWRIHACDSDVKFEIEPDPKNPDGAVLKGVHAFAVPPAIARAAHMIDDLWRFNWGNLQAHLAGGQGKFFVDYGSGAPEVALSVFIDASPAAVFRTLIDPEKIQQWFGVAAEVDPRLGGAWRLKMEVNGVTAPPCKILDYVEAERLTLSWPDWRGDPTVPDQRVTWLLKPEGAGTRVEFVHEGFVRAADISDYPFGWGWFLSRISAVAEGKSLEAPPAHC